MDGERNAQRENRALIPGFRGLVGKGGPDNGGTEGRCHRAVSRGKTSNKKKTAPRPRQKDALSTSPETRA